MATNKSGSLHFFHLSKKLDKKIHKGVEKLIYVIAFVEPLSTIPQVIEVYSKQSADDLSLLSWILWFIAAFVWLLYGFYHKSKPIIIASVLWIVFYIVLIWAIIIY